MTLWKAGIFPSQRPRNRRGMGCTNKQAPRGSSVWSTNNWSYNKDSPSSCPVLLPHNKLPVSRLPDPANGWPDMTLTKLPIRQPISIFLPSATETQYWRILRFGPRRHREGGEAVLIVSTQRGPATVVSCLSSLGSAFQ